MQSEHSITIMLVLLLDLIFNCVKQSTLREVQTSVTHILRGYKHFTSYMSPISFVIRDFKRMDWLSFTCNAVEANLELTLARSIYIYSLGETGTGCIVASLMIIRWTKQKCRKGSCILHCLRTLRLLNSSVSFCNTNIHHSFRGTILWFFPTCPLQYGYELSIWIVELKISRTRKASKTLQKKILLNLAIPSHWKQRHQILNPRAMTCRIRVLQHEW